MLAVVCARVFRNAPVAKADEAQIGWAAEFLACFTERLFHNHLTAIKLSRNHRSTHKSGNFPQDVSQTETTTTELRHYSDMQQLVCLWPIAPCEGCRTLENQKGQWAFYRLASHQTWWTRGRSVFSLSLVIALQCDSSWLKTLLPPSQSQVPVFVI